MEKTTIQIYAPLKVIAKPQSANRAYASFVPQAQPDLLFMKSVLVSTGANKNDDVFLPEEMWKALSTPILKPVDWEHNTGRELSEEEFSQNPGKVLADNQTIGVMYNTYAIDENGVIINSEQASASDFGIPNEFHIVDEAVIWKGLYPKTASRIEKGAAQGTLFVSMEAWFGNYDYLLGDKIVARNEETAFLEESLRANGGTGRFCDDSVKRVLRGLCFGGKGIVERPANEPSIIQSVTHRPITEEVMARQAIAKNIICDIRDFKTEGSRKESIQMSDNNVSITVEDFKSATQQAAEANQELKVKASELEAANSQIEDLNTQVDNIKSAFSKGAVLIEEALPTLAGKLANVDASEFFNTIADAIKATNEKTVEIQSKLDEVQANLDKAIAEKRNVERNAKIDVVLADFPGDDNAKTAKREAMVAFVENLDDDAFASYIEQTKELIALAGPGSQVDKSQKEKKKKQEEKSDASDGITDESVLDSVTASETPPAAGENTDEVEDLHKSYAGLVSTIMGYKPENQDN